MAIDGKLLAKAKKNLEKARRGHEAEIARRTAEVYAKAPCIRGLDIQIRENMLRLAGAAFGGQTYDLPDDIRLKNAALQNERRSELLKAGFREDYLDDDYMCDACNDTGYVRNTSPGKPYVMCLCLKKLYRTEKRASLSSLLKLGSESFDSFDLSFYDDTPLRKGGVSHREHMKDVYDTCVKYAHEFGRESMNLLLSGAPGLGKTFLSACIARVVSDKDFSVVYDMAGSVFSKFEDAKFSKVDDLDETREEIKRYLGCDLLIIDDLGVEMKTVFINEALYEIVNTRLITNRKTIINTNLTIDEMRLRYSEQIMSRLEGEYQELKFLGSDIRKQKKELEI